MGGCSRNYLIDFPLFFANNEEEKEEHAFMAVTKRQKQVLDFVSHFIEDNGYSPSYEEIARGLNLASLATVHKHISTLETKQYLKRGFNQSRSLDLGPKYIQEQRKHRQDTSLEVPLLGRIAAGAPVEAVEQRETVRFGDFLGNPDVFALEVRGDSMIEDHICSGDLVLVEKASQAKDGDIVVALIEGAQTTLKRFYKEPGDRVRLQPANSSLQPIFVAGKDLAIQGRLLAVLRKYK
jgi:repressor LexA